jgi:hypothetical protein
MFGPRLGRGKAAGAVLACAVMLLAGCGGSEGSPAEASAPIIRGVPHPNGRLTVSNTLLTGLAGSYIALTASGGLGNGAVNFTVTGTGCSVDGKLLNATVAGTCIVTATKESSTSGKDDVRGRVGHG